MQALATIHHLSWTCGCSINYSGAGNVAVAWNACADHLRANATQARSREALKPLGRMTPRTSIETSILGELIQCGCSHPISAHTRSGCDGAQPHACACLRTANEVLEAALSSARTTWGAWSEPA
jgi:hypothetical protein